MKNFYIYIKIFAVFIFMTLAALQLDAAEVIEDDSTPYMLYSERVETAKPAPTQKQTPKTSAKKQTSKKKTPTKKSKTTRKAAAKQVPAKTKISSLERGIELMKAERYEAAKPYLLKAIQENRNDPNAWYWYGVYHERTGGFYQAQYFYSKAVTIDPAFEPLSRVVYYPNDAEKTPLWDPKRPARVYPVATANDDVTIASRGNFPSAPNDPEIPKVPVYTPPEPASNPMDGDSWAPAVYVPPMPEESPVNNGTSVYNPPHLNRVEAIQNTKITENYSYKIPGYSNTYNNNANSNVRADLPLYNPPEPGQIVTQSKQDSVITKEEVKPVTVKKSTQNKTVPRKIVKKSEPLTQNKNKKVTEKTKHKSVTKKEPVTQVNTKTQDANVAPKKPQPKQQVQQPKNLEPVPPIEQEKKQPERRQIEYLPPVGQFPPDPGTISEFAVPPVGQDSQY